MPKPWFAPLGWTYRPISWQGYAIAAAFAAFCAQAWLAVDRHAHSASDALFGFFPYAAPAFLLFNWVASKTSRTGPH